MDANENKFYVIGGSINSLVDIEFKTYNEFYIKMVIYGCLLYDSYIFRTFEDAFKVLNEMKEREKEISFVPNDKDNMDDDPNFYHIYEINVENAIEVK